MFKKPTSEVYSSIARLLSATYGTYLITTCANQTIEASYEMINW